MELQEEYLFWRLVHHLITTKEYRIIQLSQDQKELWLEKTENRDAQIIRLVNHPIDWSNWLQRDIELTAINADKIRSKFLKGNLNIVNIYISPYPPVDDYEFIIQPYNEPTKGKVTIYSYLIERSNTKKCLEEMNKQFGDLIPSSLEDSESDLNVEVIKHTALSEAKKRAKKEKAIFNFGKPFFTYIFIFLQVTAFILMELYGGSTNTSTLIKFGAKFNPLIIQGEWWRFFTPIILHIGMLHLLMNTLALFFLGSLVERIFGNVRFLLIYLLAGFSGSLGSFLVNPVLSAGASGAIFGLFGALLYFGIIYPRLFFRTIGMNVIIVLGLNLAFGFTVPGIDNAGHIGGLIGGFAAAAIVHFPKRKKPVLQMIFLVVTTIVLWGLITYGYNDSIDRVSERSALILAQEYIQAEQYDQAYTFLKGYIENNPGTAETLFLLSYVEIKRENLTEAKNYLIHVIDQKPDFHEAHYNLALIYLEIKNLDEAQFHAEHAVQIMPDQKEYRELLQRINNYLEDADGG